MSGTHTAIEYLKGVGPERARLLKEELDIKTFQDLLHFFPSRYIDRSQFYKMLDTKNMIHLNETTMRTVNKGEFDKYIYNVQDGIDTIDKLECSCKRSYIAESNVLKYASKNNEIATF